MQQQIQNVYKLMQNLNRDVCSLMEALDLITRPTKQKEHEHGKQLYNFSSSFFCKTTIYLFTYFSFIILN